MCEPDNDDAEEFELSQLAQEYDDQDDDHYCPTCSGTGEGQYDGTRCRSCNGSGVLQFPKDEDDFDIPEPDYCDEEGNRL